jgi:hypothetical protein
MTSRAAARKRRLARLRATALPTFLLQVNPTRIVCAEESGSCGPAGAACNIKPGAAHLRREAATRRNSARRFSRPTAFPMGSGGQALAALTATIGDHAAAADGGHTGAEAMTTGTNQLAGLIGTLHGTNSEK